MMGWRIGYLAYPEALGQQLLKAQDTIPICPPAVPAQDGKHPLFYVDQRKHLT